MYESSDLRKGLKIELDGDPHIIVQFEFVKPGKGQALYKCKLKNMLTGAQFDKTFRSGDKFNAPNLEEVEMEYLYADNYAGLFRNPKAREGAEAAIYNEHLYPVFSSGRCRQNVTGIPNDEELARKHVEVFAEQCY